MTVAKIKDANTTKSKSGGAPRGAKDTLKRSRPPGANDRTASVMHPTSRAAAQDVWNYVNDTLQRSVLFLDVLRQRGDNMLEHERDGLPALLDFKYETILDARQFDVPVNYALLRITEVGEDCWEDCVDPAKPPVIVVDPRAGHGPGIGGFKHESEVGIALHEGHPVYFVIFFPQPAPGQTLADVHAALRRFVNEVGARHPEHKPVLYGNCQAGWALTLLAADCKGLEGPVVLNGSPLSYWAGDSGVNPLRYSGGLLGGSWLAHFISDLGDGRFDGAWLAQNFENLQPEKALWEKYANLFSNIDDENERFLEFERWWNGFYALGREEILAIVENLFIGNRLEQGGFKIHGDCAVDLRRIRNPLVIFASYGDNITPPQQALGWIPVVYRDTADLKNSGQRIVYLTNPHVGHLGLFVSARTARLEHRAILESLQEIEALDPGLYEMKIDNPTGDPDCRKPQYAVRFVAREVENLVPSQQTEAFERVRAVSQFNETLYSTCVSPWVRAAANPWGAEMMKWAHPMRSSRYMFSTAFNPWMRGLAVLAAATKGARNPLAKDHPMMTLEREMADQVSDAIKTVRLARDDAYETLFDILYDSANTASDNG